MTESGRSGEGHRRTAIVALLVVGLLAVAATAGITYVRSQFYVGIDGEQVAVFRGVTGSVAGLELSSVEERTELTTERLDRLARSRVERGVVAKDRPEALEIVARLEDSFPPCTPADEVPIPAALPTAAPAPVPSGSAAAPTPAPSPALCPGVSS